MTAPAAVVFTTQAPFIGGAERSLIRLCAALDPARYRPLVLTGQPGRVLQALRAEGVDAVHVPLPRPDRARPVPFLLSVARIAWLLHRHRAALVHTNDPPAHPAASLAARLLRVPRLCHVHFTYPAAGLRWWLRWGLEQALFASDYAKRETQVACPELFPERRCAVVANGFDPPPTPSEAAVRALRVACGIDDAAAVVALIGRMIEDKGVEEFLHMAQALRAQHPRCRFLIAGDDHRPPPNHRTAMEALADRLGIAGACRFLGFRDDVWTLLHCCDVIAMPSRTEPFGNVAVEAGAAGRAVVATRVGGIPEIVRDGDTGLLVAAGDVPALTAAISALLADPTRRVALGARARAHVLARFSLAAQANAVMHLYDAVRRASDRRARSA